MCSSVIYWLLMWHVLSIATHHNSKQFCIYYQTTVKRVKDTTFQKEKCLFPSENVMYEVLSMKL